MVKRHVKTKDNGVRRWARGMQKKFWSHYIDGGSVLATLHAFPDKLSVKYINRKRKGH